MTILIFLALALVTIVLAVLINRLVHCPLLVGFVFFSITLLVAVILSNITLVILAIILGILAFLSAFFDCIFKRCSFFRNNNCLNCSNPYADDNGNNNETLTIINGNGEVVARISGNSITCNNNDDNGNNCGCGCSGRNNLLAELSDSNAISTTSTTSSNSSCGCCNRSYRRR